MGKLKHPNTRREGNPPGEHLFPVASLPAPTPLPWMPCLVGAENWKKFGKSPFARVSTLALAWAAPAQGWVKKKENLWVQYEKKGLVSK